MRAELVDPRDARWEQERPVFRVFLEHDGAVDAYDVQEATVSDVHRWIAERTRPVTRWSLWLRVDDPREGLGLIRLDAGGA